MCKSVTDTSSNFLPDRTSLTNATALSDAVDLSTAKSIFTVPFSRLERESDCFPEF
jgi:hypothetical protein